MTGFDGFSPEVATFFEGLRRDNTKAWFDAHRADHREWIKEPMEALLAEAEPRYGSGRVMRPNRDVRFTPDKTPYRTSASLWAGAVGGVYLQLSAGGLQVGGGLYEPSRDQLARAREVVDTRPGPADELESLIRGLEDDGYEIAGPSLATAPRGYPRDHPRIELLRLKHVAALRSMPLDSPRDSILDAWQRLEPLNAWIARWIGPAERRP